jgi:putative tryptophan/tyrosine transport system substrate-binding protein
MRRREFIALLGSAAAGWPLAARGQQAAMPVIGFLHAGAPEANANNVQAFRKGLGETGHVEGGNVSVIQAFASPMGVELTPINLPAEEWEQELGAFARGPTDGLIVVVSVVAAVQRARIVQLAAQHRLPAVYFNRSFVEAGGLISYGLRVIDNYRRTAAYVDRILKGEKPAELPVQAPTKYELVINLKTAKALGLTLPPTLLARADEVIE